MPTLIEEKNRALFNYLNSKNGEGVTKKELDNYFGNMDLLFTGFISVDDIVEKNLLIGRVKKEQDRLFLSKEGRDYFESQLTR